MIAWPTDEQAMEEKRTEEHGGLYWTSVKNDDDEDMRLSLPNYFNTFREALWGNPLYANLIGNRGTVLEMLGPGEEAWSTFPKPRSSQGCPENVKRPASPRGDEP